MPEKLPKGVRRIGLNGSAAGTAGAFTRMRVLESDLREIEENLAIEEALVRQTERGVLSLLFWRNEACVVIGRHQDPEAECRMDAAEKLGVRIARRRTGGGAVFQDAGNLNVSFMATADSLDEEICERILLRALAKCGIRARRTGRNDLVLEEGESFHQEGTSGAGEGGKFSGSASLQTPEGNFLFHATLMFHVDLDRMTAVLKASPDKLARHRIASVRSRVANLCDAYPDLRMETVMTAIIAESAAFLQSGRRV